jgi:hypothetical protein
MPALSAALLAHAPWGALAPLLSSALAWTALRLGTRLAAGRPIPAMSGAHLGHLTR